MTRAAPRHSRTRRSTARKSLGSYGNGHDTAGAPPSSSQRSRALATLSRDVGGVGSPSLVSPLARSPDRLGVFIISRVAKWPSALQRTCLRRLGLPALL